MQPNPTTIPKHIEAERRLIGGILALNSNYDELPEELRLSGEHFSDRVLGQVWDWMVAHLDRGLTVDEHMLAPAMRKLATRPEDDPKHLSPEDAEPYLKALTAAASVITLKKVVIDAAKVVKNYALWREAQEVGQDLVDIAGEATPDQDPAEMIGDKIDRLVRIQSTGGSSGHMSLDQAMMEAIALTEQAQIGMVGVSTGLACLDRRIGGLQNGAVHVLAGRPSMGKTALALLIARNAALVCRNEKRGVSVFASYEMPEKQLAQRLLANEASMPIDQQIASKLSLGEHERRIWELKQAAGRLQGIPLHLGFGMPKNIRALTSYVKKMHREMGGVRLLTVDYLQLMSGNNTKDRVQEISEISRGLKTLATDLNIPILALSQLSRAVEQREDKRPMLSDLRESGSIEQDADIVMFTFREDYYLSRAEPPQGDKYAEWCRRMTEVKGKAELITAKLRQGEIGTDYLEYEGKYFLFKDLNQPKAR